MPFLLHYNHQHDMHHIVYLYIYIEFVYIDKIGFVSERENYLFDIILRQIDIVRQDTEKTKEYSQPYLQLQNTHTASILEIFSGVVCEISSIEINPSETKSCPRVSSTSKFLIRVSVLSLNSACLLSESSLSVNISIS